MRPRLPTICFLLAWKMVIGAAIKFSNSTMAVIFPVSQVVIAHKGPTGRLEFVSTIARDITDYKQLEAQMQAQLNHDPRTERGIAAA